MMSYVDYTVAMDLICKKTKQQCNAFTILHYIRNQLLDLYFEAEGEFDVCKCFIFETETSQYDTALHIFSKYQGYLKLNISEIKDQDLFNVLVNGGQLRITFFKGADLNLDYILLSEELEVKRNYIKSSDLKAQQLLSQVEVLYRNTVDSSEVTKNTNSAPLSSVIALLGIVQNKVFKLNDLKFSVDQIEKLQNKPIIEQNPKARGSQIKVADQNWISNFSIDLAKKFKDSVPELQKNEISKLIKETLATFEVIREEETIEGWIFSLFPSNPLGRPPKSAKKDQ